MALDQSALLEVLEALKAADVEDRIRHAAETIYQALIEAESPASGRCPHPLVLLHGGLGDNWHSRDGGVHPHPGLPVPALPWGLLDRSRGVAHRPARRARDKSACGCARVGKSRCQR